MTTRRFFAFALVFALVIGLSPLFMTSAHDLSATPVSESRQTGVLATFAIVELPTPHAEVWFLRMELTPGGSMPAGTQSGPTVIFVEKGALTLNTDRSVIVSTDREIATPGSSAASPAIVEFETVLRPGDSAIVADGTTLLTSNRAAEPTIFLTLFMFAAEREAESGEGELEPIGLTQQGLSVAAAEFPVAPGTVTIERIQIALGDTLESDAGNGMSVGGIDLGAIEQGSADVTFATGSSWLWPNIMNEFTDRRPIDPGATLPLRAGDGYSTYDGLSSWTATGAEPLVLLRAVVMPID